MSESPTSREAISHSYAPIPATTIGPLRVVWGSRTYIMAVATFLLAYFVIRSTSKKL